MQTVAFARESKALVKAAPSQSLLALSRDKLTRRVRPFK